MIGAKANRTNYTQVGILRVEHSKLAILAASWIAEAVQGFQSCGGIRNIVSKHIVGTLCGAESAAGKCRPNVFPEGNFRNLANGCLALEQRGELLRCRIVIHARLWVLEVGRSCNILASQSAL